MEQVLSQNEVNALLNAVNDGRLAVDELDQMPEGDYELYDLASQDKIIRGRMAGLELINDRLTRYLQIAMSNLLRKMVEVQLEYSGLMKFGEFINQLVGPTVMNMFKMSPLRGISILSIESRFVFSMINSFFGGSPEGDKIAESIETRDFTVIEMNIIRKVVRTILSELQRSWNPVHEMNPSFLRMETNPQFLGVIPSADVCINTQFTIEFSGAVGIMNLVIPYSMIEPIKQKLSISSQSDEHELDMDWIRRLKTEMLKAEVNMLVELGYAELSVDELRNLAVGDVIMLDTDATEALVLKIENVPKMTGKPIVHKGHVALRIESTDISEEPQASL